MGLIKILLAVTLLCVNVNSGSADRALANPLDKLGQEATSRIWRFLGQRSSCLYNGELFNNGEIVAVAEEACAKIVCKVVWGSNSQLSTSNLKLQPLENCQCQLLTKRTFGLPFLSGFKKTLKKVSTKLSNEFDHTENVNWNTEEGCYFNGHLVLDGGIADNVPLGCAQLRCEKVVLDGPAELSIFVNQECSCSVVAVTTTTTTTQMPLAGMTSDGRTTAMMTDGTTPGMAPDGSPIDLIYFRSPIGIINDGSLIRILNDGSPIGIMNDDLTTGMTTGMMPNDETTGMTDGTTTGMTPDGSPIDLIYFRSPIGIINDGSPIGIINDGSPIGIMNDGLTTGMTTGMMPNDKTTGMTDGTTTGRMTNDTAAEMTGGVTTGMTDGSTTGMTGGGTTGMTGGGTTGMTGGGTTGMTGGVTTGMTGGVTTGMTGGVTTGMTGGVTTGMTGGGTTGMTGGVTTGMTDGSTTGMTGGGTTGMTGGVTTGITGGVTGMTGGVTTGMTDGVTTGMTDGVTTGMTDGTTTGMMTDGTITGMMTDGTITGMIDGTTTGMTGGMTTGMTGGMTTGMTGGVTTELMTDGTTTGMMTGSVTSVVTTLGRTTDGTTSGMMTGGMTTGIMTGGVTTQETTNFTSPFPTTTDAATTPSPCSRYAQFAERHTMCLSPNPRCFVKESGISAAEKDTIVKTHNLIRALMATGVAEAGSNGALPPSSNMKELKWNQELAEIALAWASQCPSDHDCYNCRVPVTTPYSVTGQNIYKSYGIQGIVEHDVTSVLGNIPQWEDAIGAWSNESAYVDVGFIRAFRPRVEGRVVGHFSQLVWAKTGEIGCASTTYGPCTDKSGTGLFAQCHVFVCNYGPAGNYVGEQVYAEGVPASMCDNGRSTLVAGLCNP